jgi:hypothetical protein
MTDKKLKIGSVAYTELSIQIAILSAKVDKLLELAMKPQEAEPAIGDKQLSYEDWEIEPK